MPRTTYSTMFFCVVLLASTTEGHLFLARKLLVGNMRAKALLLCLLLHSLARSATCRTPGKSGGRSHVAQDALPTSVHVWLISSDDICPLLRQHPAILQWVRPSDCQQPQPTVFQACRDVLSVSCSHGCLNPCSWLLALGTS